MDRSEFLYPRSRYYGRVTAEKVEPLLFNANLQEFAQRVMLISCLQSGGKLSPEESYQKIEQLWCWLEQSSQQLGIAGERS